jgi:hypothetical protein
MACASGPAIFLNASHRLASPDLPFLDPIFTGKVPRFLLNPTHANPGHIYRAIPCGPLP